MEINETLVIHVRSFYTKIGFAGEYLPILVERTAVVKDINKKFYCGNEVIK